VSGYQNLCHEGKKILFLSQAARIDEKSSSPLYYNVSTLVFSKTETDSHNTVPKCLWLMVKAISVPEKTKLDHYLFGYIWNSQGDGR